MADEVNPSLAIFFVVLMHAEPPPAEARSPKRRAHRVLKMVSLSS